MLRRLGHHSFEMKAILKHAATTMNALETTDSTCARELIVMRAKNSLLSHSRSLNEDLFGSRILRNSPLRFAHFIFLAHFNVT